MHHLMPAHVTRTIQLVFVSVLSLGTGQSISAQPVYSITAMSLAGQANSNGQGISASGEFVTGTSDNDGVIWNALHGTVAIPALPGRSFTLPQDINDAGVAVGTGATTFFGSSPLPLIWIDSVTVAQLPLPAGQTIGRAYSVNNSNEAAGSVNGGSTEIASRFTTSTGTIVSETMPNGGVLRTAYANNDAGRIVGQALDPTNAAVTKGFYLDPGDTTATDIGALDALGHNSAIAFAVAGNGLIAGSSSLNSGADLRAFVWSDASGMTEVPLLAGTTSGGARGVNSHGWVVGTMSSATSIPFLYDGTTTYRLQDLLDGSGAGWDLVGGTSNGAFGIGDNGVITGRGLLNGEVTGFIMTPVADSDADGIPDTLDNCLNVQNPQQQDTDDDNIGNHCDPDVAVPNDCQVNFLDLIVYSDNFFQPGDLDTDNNGDGQTNFLDLAIVSLYFFGLPGPSANGCN